VVVPDVAESVPGPVSAQVMVPVAFESVAVKLTAGPPAVTVWVPDGEMATDGVVGGSFSQPAATIMAAAASASMPRAFMVSPRLVVDLLLPPPPRRGGTARRYVPEFPTFHYL
jgi:hypothetical protein